MQPGQEATPAGVTRTHCRVHLPAFHQYPCAQSLECLPVAHEDSAKALQTVPAMGPPPPASFSHSNLSSSSPLAPFADQLPVCLLTNSSFRLHAFAEASGGPSPAVARKAAPEICEKWKFTGPKSGSPGGGQQPLA